MRRDIAKTIGNRLRSALADRSGSVALVFAICLPVLMTVTAGVIDYAMAIHQKTRLQSVVDGVTLSAAKELSLSNTNTDQVSAVIDGMVKSHFAAMRSTSNPIETKVETSITKEPLRVSVSATQEYNGPFGGAFGFDKAEINAKAVAQVIGRPNICVLVLDRSDTGVLSLEQEANVTGDNCAIYSNSTHSVGIKAKGTSRLAASTICSAGGVQDTEANFDPPPYTDCPQFDDPLEGRAAPFVSACKSAEAEVISFSRQLSPGTYCGLTITSGAEVTLSPGVYVIRDNPLVVTDGAGLTGKGVTLYFTGSGAYFDFHARSSVSLQAATTGLTSGLLIFSARSLSETNKILSENAQVMVGTIYVPGGEVYIDGSANIGTDSAYTAIVAGKLRIYGGPHVKLNTNYDETDVPVPDGIKGAGQPVSLVQ